MNNYYKKWIEEIKDQEIKDTQFQIKIEKLNNSFKTNTQFKDSFLQNWEKKDLNNKNTNILISEELKKNQNFLESHLRQ